MDQILEKKYKSIEEFKKALLDGRVRNKIAKIVLPGSVLRFYFLFTLFLSPSNGKYKIVVTKTSGTDFQPVKGHR